MTKVFINAGHCVGKDSGAVGNGFTEAEKVLAIGRAVIKYLSAAGCDSRLVQLDSFANGTETYCFAKNTTAERLANAIHERIIKTFPELTNRGVKTANFSVLRNTKMPACLVETAFISNSNDAKLLVEREDDFAACGITDFLSIKPDVVDVCPACGRDL